MEQTYNKRRKIDSKFIILDSPPNTLLLSFKGRSSSSTCVSCALFKFSISTEKLLQLRKLFQVVNGREIIQEVTYPNNVRHKLTKYFFRMNENVPGDTTFKAITGVDKKNIWKAIANQEQQEWHQKLNIYNQELYQKLEQTARYQYDTQTDEFIWSNPDINNFKDNIFSLASLTKNEWFIQDNTTEPQDRWHCDGGASMVFIAITLTGSRRLIIENNEKERKVIILNEGDCYLSQTSCFWHCVAAGDFVDGYSSCTSLLFRSTVLSKRLSGGFENKLTKFRSGGRHLCRTKKIFEHLSQNIHDIILTIQGLNI